MDYIAPIYKSAAEARGFPVAAIDSFMWDGNGCRPESYAAAFGIEGEGMHILLWSFEEDIRCECTERDEPVYTDSCLEFFVMPFEDDRRYMNFEVNKNGVYLSQIGTCRNDRVFIKELTDLEPTVAPIEIDENGDKAWGCEITVPDSFISALYGKDFSFENAKIKGNFYKCGDKTNFPHYGAHFPVSIPSPDFHRPDYFGNIIFRKA